MAKAAAKKPLTKTQILSNIADATGFGFEGKMTESPDEAWEFLRETIDAGKPVRSPHIEEMIFAGYHDAPTKADRQAFAMARRCRCRSYRLRIPQQSDIGM